MRLIDADALLERVGSEKIQAQAHGREFSTCFNSPGGTLSTEWWYVEDLIENAPTIEPERKKDTIQKFHDYQVEWLLAHCDLELEPQLEEWVVRFLHDTANCYMMEIDRAEGEQE